MDKIDRLLKDIRRTNPDMNKKRLIKELGKCRYSASGLIMAWESREKVCKTQA